MTSTGHTMAGAHQPGISAATDAPTHADHQRRGEVMFVGPSARFLSGISYYTARIARAFAESDPAGGSLLFLRRLCPAFIYPGRDRIGAHTNSVLGVDSVPRHDGIDWFWGPGMLRALGFVWRRRPEALVLQWWTGTVAHSFILLGVLARLRGTKVVIEFHETLDVGEAALPGVRRYVNLMMRLLSRLVQGAVVHSRGDIDAVKHAFPMLAHLPFQVIHHGPLDHVERTHPERAHPERTRYVFFGVLRQYKGITELATAFASLLESGHDVELLVAGEPWPECAEDLELLRALPNDRVELRFGHLADDEVAHVLSSADVVVLPYRRSSASGPLHAAMALGLVVVTTSVPALAEVCENYSGAVLATPENPAALAEAMLAARALVGTTHQDPHSWEGNVLRYRELLDRIDTDRTDTDLKNAVRIDAGQPPHGVNPGL
jgi:glycosyltransferase involved in cell wall biosynthesis